MVEIRLSPMTEDDFKEMMSAGIIRYAEENVKAGYWTMDESLKRSRETHERVLPKGLSTEGHHFYNAMDPADGTVAGHIWFKEEPGSDRKAFIYDVFIKDEHRGKGYGKAMMLALISLAKAADFSSLALHVFASNGTALHLYESLGFETKSLNMIKQL